MCAFSACASTTDGWRRDSTSVGESGVSGKLQKENATTLDDDNNDENSYHQHYYPHSKKVLDVKSGRGQGI